MEEEEVRGGKPEDIGVYPECPGNNERLGRRGNFIARSVDVVWLRREREERAERSVRGREDEIYRIFEIPVHSACRTRRLHFSPRKPLSLSIPPSLCSSLRSLLIFGLPFLFPVSAATPTPWRLSLLPDPPPIGFDASIRTRKHPRIFSVDHGDAHRAIEDPFGPIERSRAGGKMKEDRN